MIELAETLPESDVLELTTRVRNELRVVEALNNKELPKDKIVALLKTTNFLFSDLSSKQIDELEECSQKASRQTKEKYEQSKEKLKETTQKQQEVSDISEMKKTIEEDIAALKDMAIEGTAEWID